MMRVLLLLAILLAPFSVRVLPAQVDDGPPISITSPDQATTYAYGSVKDHTLLWNKAQKVLIARVTFNDAEISNGQSNDDTHEFRLPGVTLDPVKNIFLATTAKGEVIPIAHFKKVLFFNTIVVFPNAHITILHPRGVVTVMLEAINPNDPAMHPAPSDPDGTRQVDLDKIVN
jgi:hypothetical protein